MIVTGNADMHLKNWTLIYPDEHHPQLSPAYDFVPTILYPNTYDKLALKLAGENRFQYLSKQTFKDFAAIAKLPEKAVRTIGTGGNERIYATFVIYLCSRTCISMRSARSRNSLATSGRSRTS